MFTQVYFHKTRLAYDIHLQGALRELLPGGEFPGPEGSGLDDFLEWDDWRVLGLLQQGGGGEHGYRLANRKHFRRIYETPEIATKDDMEKLEQIRTALGGLTASDQSAAKSWYKTGDPDIQVLNESNGNQAVPLSKYSSVVKNLAQNNQIKVFVQPENVVEAREKVIEIERKQ